MYKYENQELNVGDTLYKINKKDLDKEPFKVIVTSAERMEMGHIVYHHNNSRESFYSKAVGRSLFKTKEEAIKELERLKKCKYKREMLKIYEAKLNKELELENHIIIK